MTKMSLNEFRNKMGVESAHRDREGYFVYMPDNHWGKLDRFDDAIDSHMYESYIYCREKSNKNYFADVRSSTGTIFHFTDVKTAIFFKLKFG